MLAIRIIPSMLVRGHTLVKGKNFNSWRSVGAALQAARIHAMRGVDELVILDIGATPEGRGPDLTLVQELSESCFCPLTIGGGVRTLKDAEALLRAGADKVAIGAAAFDNAETVRSIAGPLGSQAVVVTIDVQAGMAVSRACPFVRDPAMYARILEQAGAGEILLTSVDLEGTMDGYDLALIKDVSQAVSIPVIAHGGCKGAEDMRAAIDAGASAVAAGAVFQFTELTPRAAAKHLADQGIEVRL